MKKILLLILIIQTGLANSQSIKYKEVYSLLKDGKINDATPKLLLFLKQEPKHPNANYWAGKIYFDNAKATQSDVVSDSCILFFNRSIENIGLLDVNIMNAGRFPDFKGLDATEVLADGKKWMQEKINEVEFLKQEIQYNKSKKENEKKQIEWASKNTGENDPMIIAKMYFEADKNGDIETLIKLGKKNEINGSIGPLKQASIDAYNKDKNGFASSWKKEILTRRLDYRLTDNTKDFDFEEYYDKGSHTWQPKLIESSDGYQYDNSGEKYIAKIPMRVEYNSETHVVINGLASYKGRKGTYTSYYHVEHLSMVLEKISGKWQVVAYEN